MSRMPSLTALLALVALAGYKNRDKIADFVKGLNSQQTGGLGDLVDHVKKGGLGQTIDSWVAKGENQPVTENQLDKALGPDLIDAIAKQTGLSREDLLDRLSKVLPEAVDKMTPDGRLPA